MILYRRTKRQPLNTMRTRELLGPKEWEKQMVSLSLIHKDVKWMRYNFIVGNYNQEAYKKLNQIRCTISDINSDIIALIPSARWLFDNFQMMYREIKKVKTTGTSYERLPVLRSGEYRSFPRIYVIARKLVELSGGFLNEENITLMLKAYQKEQPLIDKELWVLPEMIGMALLERIIEVAEEIIHVIKIKDKADRYVKTKFGDLQGNLDIAPLLKKLPGDCSENASYHSHVIYLLRNMSVGDEAIQRYINFHCNREGKHLNSSEVFIEEGKLESVLESGIRTLICSLREVNQIDEEVLFEELSLVENILQNDPANIYAGMDADSRGLYRGIVEKLAYRYRLSEGKVSNLCIALAKHANPKIHCSDHVGAYLVGKGYPLLKAAVQGKQDPDIDRPRKNIQGAIYFITGAVILLLFCLLLIFVTEHLESNHTILLGIVFALILFPLLSGIALEIANSLVTRFVPVQKMPSMDYLNFIPDSARTFVVMPVILSRKEQGLDYLDRLQKYYLANRQNNLYFALLVDYADAPERCMPEDEELEKALTDRITELNCNYPDSIHRFSLFIRYRNWNESENCYMGWERKRGKLEEFNALLYGIKEEDTSFSTILCDKELLGSFTYVITLDADSNLIRDNAAKLVGLIDHPLNRAVINPMNRKVEDGYAIIQPSVKNHIVDKKSGFFHRLYSGQTGITSYATVVSDIYQDVFKEGSYIGKGIYNVQAFHQLLYKTIPENSVLSHDLLESCYARTGFSSAANIMDNFPASVLAYATREHRWIRGDWQLLPWLFRKKNLSGLSRWKILDNLRRSLVPMCKVLFILLSLAFLPKYYVLWAFIILFSDVRNLIQFLLGVVIHKIRRPKLAIIYKKLWKDMLGIIQRTCLEVVFLPHRAFISVDAILRTLYRLFVSKKSLLRWKTSEAVERSLTNSMRSYFRQMWVGIIPAVIIVILLLLHPITVLGMIWYGLLCLVWSFSYLIAYQVSQPTGIDTIRRQGQQDELLTDAARRMWYFFRDFSTKENNWLCPDNYQMANKEKVTDKTSPTNIGLQLLSVLSARDFGFEPLSSTLDLIENVMYTVVVLEKWNGHLYNWYNIRTLNILDPRYISTVDSGNFFGDLIALKNGLQEQKTQPVLGETILGELKNLLRLSQTERKLKESYPDYKAFLAELQTITGELTAGDRKPWEDQGYIDQLLYAMDQVSKEITEFSLENVEYGSRVTLNDLSQQGNPYAITQVERIDGLTNTLDNLLEGADFTTLFNKKRMLFHIGYHVSSKTIDAGCYDLMASESALTSFLAIARGEVPVKHWYKLGRPQTMVKGIPAFVSWSGTMFEYLMPNLVLREYDGSVFSESSKAAVLQQMRYGRRMDIPWGISESQYFRFDLDSNYQYRAFGVPELRLQPSLSRSLVVAPYATMLALDYAGEDALINLRLLKAMDAYGKYGFYEALDFNGPDPVNMKPYCIVKSFMAHHQGMSLVAINNYLNDGVMRRRFHHESIIKATEILLEEKRQTCYISVSKKGYTVTIAKVDAPEEDIRSMRYVNTVAPILPVVGYLSNNTYSMMITSDGDGFSNYKGMMINRFRSDVHANTGNYIYIKDVKENKYWSSAYHPTYTEPEVYQVIFSPHQVEYNRKDGEIGTHTSITLSPNKNYEIHRVTLTNYSREEKKLELTSYLEVVADQFLAELSHPAFNKLFIESEYIEAGSIILSRRRGGKAGQNPYLMHMVKEGKKSFNHIQYENDRLRFIGRNNTLAHPDAIDSMVLSNSIGFSNDPIMSLRVQITLGPEEKASVFFITGVVSGREEALKISEELSFETRIDDVFENFRQQSDMELKYLGITGQQVNAFQELISPIYYPNNYYRGPDENIRRNWKNQSFLWRFGVSGDCPILLLRVDSIEEAGIIKDVLKAYEYFRINQLKVDLIILDESMHGYAQDLTDMLNDMISSLKIYDEDREHPSLFILHAYQMIPAEIDLLFTVARVVFSDKTGIYFRNVREALMEAAMKE